MTMRGLATCLAVFAAIAILHLAMWLLVLPYCLKPFFMDFFQDIFPYIAIGIIGLLILIGIFSKSKKS